VCRDVGGDDDVPEATPVAVASMDAAMNGAEVVLHVVLVDADAGHGLVDDPVVRRGR
jgi:hypothetical protein